MQSGVADDDNVCLFLLHTFRPQVLRCALFALVVFVDMVCTRKARHTCSMGSSMLPTLDGFYCFYPGLPLSACQHLYVAASLRHTLRMRVFAFCCRVFIVCLCINFQTFCQVFVCSYALSIAFHLTVANLFIAIDRHLFVVAQGL